jgi:3-isopropylmalate/(R)-2-methylmalate dehydratase small subunit
MQPFTTLTAIAAPLPLANVDTDKIIPARFLKTVRRTGLGAHLFDTLRFTPDGAERPDFVLNQSPYRAAQILIAHENFGCGSSREHAPWALLDFGIRCVIAPGFADIFYNNCFKNGVLPVRLPRPACDALIAEATATPHAPITVDLTTCLVTAATGATHPFTVDETRRKMLLEGLDEIGQTLAFTQAITAFEQNRAAQLPWLVGLTEG